MILDRIHFIQRTLKGTTVIEPPEDLPAVAATLGAIFVTPIEKLPKEVTMKVFLSLPPWNNKSNVPHLPGRPRHC